MDKASEQSSQPSVVQSVDQPLKASSEPPKELVKKSNSKIMVLVLLLVVLAGTGYGVYSYLQNTKPKPVERVKVGVLMAFSGGSSSMGYGAMKGVQLAKKQLNADNIELIQADGKCDPKVAPEAMKKLIEQEVVAIIGENCSSASVAVLSQANDNKIVMLSPSASSPRLSIPNDYFYRTVPSDIGQGNFLAETIFNQGLRNVAVFYTDEPYGAAINDVFKAKFEALGGKVLVSAPAESSVIDVQTQVDTIKAVNPQAIAVVTNSTVSSTAFMKLAREAGITAPFFGGDNLYDNTIITNGGSSAEGLKVVSFPTGTREFKQALLNEYQVEEQLYAAAEAYDAFRVIYEAIQKGATTKEKMKEVLPTISFEGVSAPIQFDENGELSANNYKYDLLEVKDGAFKIVEQ